MLQKNESREDYSGGNSNNGELLSDIEELSKALYFQKPPPKVLLSSSDGRSKSAGKTPFSDSNPRFVREDLLHKDKKSSSVWNWKKPLKALSHIGNRKFSCCFYLHVHSVEGLPLSFNNLSVCAQWKRKGEVLQTRSSKVVEGSEKLGLRLPPLNRFATHGDHHRFTEQKEFFFFFHFSLCKTQRRLPQLLHQEHLEDKQLSRFLEAKGNVNSTTTDGG
ncbi:hypothetical protein C1H46_003105 [Malus baccata]|uniref:Uncharacterized protein n=1 Tax=Malus baccata TaxID=106549 RepID=A0A540NJA0_MALBA|nr:hypothetical protein C1H46_003105 [Malus baccata]